MYINFVAKNFRYLAEYHASILDPPCPDGTRSGVNLSLCPHHTLLWFSVTSKYTLTHNRRGRDW